MRIDAVAAGCFSAKMICPRMGAQGDGPGASQPRTGTVSVQVARAAESNLSSWQRPRISVDLKSMQARLDNAPPV
jgi:hypothetical protein